MIHIAIEGIDGVGKTTVSELLSKEINYKYVHKPLSEIFGENKISEYIGLRNKINTMENRNITAWFYCLGSIYMYEKYKKENIITDRHLASNYAWGDVEYNDDIFDLVLKKIGKPKLTVILYASEEILKKRILMRNKNDKDLKKIEYSNNHYKRLEKFCINKKINYIFINTDKLTPKNIVDIIKKSMGDLNEKS
ncbi:thymidylate kinase [Spiroplasma helicoides]|uniref:Thymidylate kinase n=1 Tax=Spiroplasma helicoides TaxID=216938 RepID=A0A1B3SLR0_9MOLU|nr:AAA family ATPase [Spiroplasma helicoides]AOG60868.1 thymidylate kinase [Spiroplasma helicoides]